MDRNQIDKTASKIAQRFSEYVAGEVPEAFKKQWKDKDKDDDGKTNEEKPDFLKKKKAKAKSISFDGKNKKDVEKFLSDNGYELNSESNGKLSVKIGNKEQTIFKDDTLEMKGQKLVITKPAYVTGSSTTVVVAQTLDGEVQAFRADTIEDAETMVAEIMESGRYGQVAAGPYDEDVSAGDVISHFKGQWAE